jgi:N-acetylglucosamine kinase-like BadF-type ATPase
MHYYLGIDGGGSKTKVIVIDEQKTILYEGHGGPSSIDTVDESTTFANINQALQGFYEQYPDCSFCSIFAGLGGIVFESDYAKVQDLLKKLKGVDQHTLLTARNDMESALYSGLCFDEGMTLICGTGMVAFGRDTHGNAHKSGGWGFKVGDEGSGYDLGFQAIKHMIRAFDGRLEKTDFAIDIAQNIKLKEAHDIVVFMDARTNDRTYIANLAPIVTKHADLGNRYAKRIIDQATSELALAVQGVYQQLTLIKKTLVIVGSLGNTSGYFKEKLHQKILEVDPKIEIIKPKVDPAYAAAIMAHLNNHKK